MGERATIQRLSAEQGNRCAYCGVRLVVPGLDRRGGRTAWKEGQPNTGPRRSYKFRRATFDHVVPKSAGGKDRWDNLVVACLWRNGYRANQPADVAFLKIARRLRRRSHPHQQYETTGWRPSSNNGLRSITYPAAPVEASPPCLSGQARAGSGFRRSCRSGRRH